MTAAGKMRRALRLAKIQILEADEKALIAELEEVNRRTFWRDLFFAAGFLIAFVLMSRFTSFESATVVGLAIIYGKVS